MALRSSRVLVVAGAVVALACASLVPVAAGQSSGARPVRIEPTMSGALQSILRIRNGSGPAPALSGGPSAPTDPTSLVNAPTNDVTSHNTQSQAAVSFTGNTSAVVAFTDSGAYDGLNNHFTGWSYSSDNGKNFTDRGSLPADTIGDGGNPRMGRDQLRNQVYMVTLGFTRSDVLRMYTSTNRGSSFLPPTNPAVGNGSEAILDGQTIAVDNWPGVGTGNLYLAYRDFGPGGGIKYNRSVDGGVTWTSAVILVPDAGLGAWLTVGADHSLYLFYLDETGNVLKMRKSTDRGLTFAAATVVVDLLTTGVGGDLGLGGFRTNSFAQAVASPDGVIYLVYADDPAGTDRADVYVTATINGGTSWIAAQRVNDDTGTADNWEPAVATNPTGTKIGVSYYDRSSDPSNELMQRWARVGRIGQMGGAVSFNPSLSLGPSFPPVFGQDPAMPADFMSDFDTIAWVKKAFVSGWTDNRDSDHVNTNQPDIRRALVQTGV